MKESKNGNWLVNRSGLLVHKGCGHPEECHESGCVQFGDACPCYPEIDDDSR